MQILAFETSCDETGLALVEARKHGDAIEFKTAKEAILSQAKLHAEYGGVYPNLAKREHEKNLPILYREFADLPCDAVAVTAGPGLEPALWQGIEFAKRVAAERGVPLLPVNHMEGHLISSLAKSESIKSQDPNHKQVYKLQNIKLPVLALLISGGHTEYIVMDKWFAYRKIGETLDDAVGEAFDKVARMLGLPYPGGPEISRLAEKARQNLNENSLVDVPDRGTTRGLFRGDFGVLKLPRPMINADTCDTSFSGLKTAVLYALRDLTKVRPLSDEERAAFAAEFEDAVADVFVAKTRKALQESGAQTLVVGGGVAANRYIRERLQKLVLDEFPEVELRLPDPAITGDNAVMIAQAALARRLSGLDEAATEDIKAVGNLSIAG